MDNLTPNAIAPEERTLAALTHLSGLSGYVIPLGGAIVPLVIWMVRKDSPVVSTIAKQALWLNFMVYVAVALSAVLFITVILIPVVFLFWGLVGLTAIVLPIIGAIRANDGAYYRYPLVGLRLG